MVGLLGLLSTSKGTAVEDFSPGEFVLLAKRCRNMISKSTEKLEDVRLFTNLAKSESTI